MIITTIAIFAALIPPILFAGSNFIDSKLVRSYAVGPLMAVSGFFNLIVAAGLFLVMVLKHTNFQWNGIFFLFLNGIFYTLGTWIYLSVLSKEESSRAVPFFQSIPVFGLVLAYFLIGEKLALYQILGVMLLVFGGVILAVKDGVFRKKMAIMMLISSIFIAINDVFFAYFGRELGVLSALFGDILGKGVICTAVLVRKDYWSEFYISMKGAFVLQATNESMFIFGDMIFDWAKLLAPVALVQALASTQPLFLLLFAYIAFKMFPKNNFEDFTGRNKWVKISGVLLMVIGGVAVSL